MKWSEMSLDQFKPVNINDEDQSDLSDFSQYLKILQRFNLIQQKNSQKMETLRSEAISTLEKSRELVHTFILERTQLKNTIALYEKSILSILDLFSHMKTTAEGADNKEYSDFLNPANKYIEQTLETIGWEQIPTQGLKANSELHYVVGTKPCEDNGRKELISGVVLPGYRCGDRVIRKAEVTVYK